MSKSGNPKGVSSEVTPFKHCAGGVRFRVILVVLTLILAGGGISVFLQRQEQTHRIDLDKAVTIRDYGMQKALLLLGSDPNRDNGLPRTPYNDGWYEVTLKRRESKDSVYVTITATGSTGSAAVTDSRYLVRSLDSADSHGWKLLQKR